MSDNDIVAVRMPKWGMAMEEGTLVAWLAKEGDRVNAGDIIAEVESTKVTGELEARAAGILRRQVASEGDIVSVGALLAIICSAEVQNQAIDSFVAENATEVQRKEIGTQSSLQSITVGGREISYLASGAGGIPAILVHGFGGSKNVWALTEQDLAQHRLVVMPDLPGHGASSKDVGAGDIKTMQDVIAALMSKLGFDRVHLVGHSFGGAVALAFAEANPEKVASLSLIASVGLGREINGAYLSTFAAGTRMRELKAVTAQLFADPSFVTGTFIDELARYKSMDGVSDALSQIVVRCFPDGAQSPTLQRRAVARSLPSQILWGSEDRIIPVAHAEGMNNVTVIPGVGHMAPIEDPKTVNSRLMHFMAEMDKLAGETYETER